MKTMMIIIDGGDDYYDKNDDEDDVRDIDNGDSCFSYSYFSCFFFVLFL